MILNMNAFVKLANPLSQKLVNIVKDAISS